MSITTTEEYQRTVEAIQHCSALADQLRTTLIGAGLSDEEVAGSVQPLERRIEALFREVHAYEMLLGSTDQPVRWLTTIGTFIEAVRVSRALSVADFATLLGLPCQETAVLSSTDFSGLTLQQAQDALDKLGIGFELKLDIAMPVGATAR